MTDMPNSRRPHLVEKKLLFGLRSKTWSVPDDADHVLFRHRKDPSRYAILHRSTKKVGMWQLTRFDGDGPIGDVNRDTPMKAVTDGLVGNHDDWILE